MKYQINKTPQEVLRRHARHGEPGARPGRRPPRRRRGVQRHGRQPLGAGLPGRRCWPWPWSAAPPPSTCPTRWATPCLWSSATSSASSSACARRCTTSRSACTATTTWAWPPPTRWPRCAPAPAQVECAINGIGERAGNASLEEVVMAIHTRGDYFAADTGVDTEEIVAHQPPGEHAHGLRQSSATRPSWGATPSPTRAASTRPACSTRPVDLRDHEAGRRGAGRQRHRAGQALRAARAAAKLAELGYALSGGDLDEAFRKLQGRGRQEEARHGARPGGAGRAKRSASARTCSRCAAS